MFYVVGMALCSIAFISAAMSGDILFAGTFGIVIVYLGARYWMVATGRP
ncbi:hypothetical protein C490_00360 [Natronobacterium gregoryi SP2]|uniref:Uncharacterized protein n=1 Tax=Natronobacterium gregoryi (strain ATCC 43098 / DSM 3393 / CCM 3738 / CIP 104747 / IAM 13177 / JCM 8860 / NBRC 102187 / NCIMB 2189 / SP2) TaxID=797304 RepID=L9YN74_NATGS|nr:hypothetical protein C490_00360 [Natronobacterium gregoryi SP2]